MAGGWIPATSRVQSWEVGQGSGTIKRSLPWPDPGRLLRLILEGGALRRSTRSEPGGERVSEPQLSHVSHPRHISVRPNQHGAGSRDRPECRKLPRTDVLGVDQPDPICPRSDVEAAGLAEVEQHRPGIVQQGEDPQRTVWR